MSSPKEKKVLWGGAFSFLQISCTHMAVNFIDFAAKEPPTGSRNRAQIAPIQMGLVPISRLTNSYVRLK